LFVQFSLTAECAENAEDENLKTDLNTKGAKEREGRRTSRMAAGFVAGLFCGLALKNRTRGANGPRK